jgi:hypothetical protein
LTGSDYRVNILAVSPRFPPTLKFKRINTMRPGGIHDPAGIFLPPTQSQIDITLQIHRRSLILITPVRTWQVHYAGSDSRSEQGTGPSSSAWIREWKAEHLRHPRENLPINGQHRCECRACRPR